MQEHSWAMAKCCPRQNAARSPLMLPRLPQGHTVCPHITGDFAPPSQGTLLPWQAEAGTSLPATPGTVLEARGHPVAFPCAFCGVPCCVTLLLPHLPARMQSLLNFRVCALILCFGPACLVPAGSGITAPTKHSSPPAHFLLSTRPRKTHELT